MATPMITAALASAFKSDRLYYIRINKDDENFKSYLRDQLNDPVTSSLTSAMLIRPQGPSEVGFLLEQFSSALMGVAICLSPAENAKETGTDVVVDASKPLIIGDMVLGSGGIREFVAHNRHAELGLAIKADYQNKGYGAEAINWMLDWAFQHASLHSVQLGTFSYNTRAAHLYEKLGFVLEGRRRECIRFNRQWHDYLEFGMTEDEWAKIRGL